MYNYILFYIMKNHFFFGWYGNKRMEVDKIYEFLNLDDIETIIEPFCGSSSISYFISTKHPKKFKYILNDNDKTLIECYKFIQKSSDEEIIEFQNKIMNKLKTLTKEEFKNLDINNDLVDYFIHHTVYHKFIGRFPIEEILNKRFRNMKIALIDKPIYKFIKEENIEFLCDDAITVYEKYKDDEKICYY